MLLIDNYLYSFFLTHKVDTRKKLKKNNLIKKHYIKYILYNIFYWVHKTLTKNNSHQNIFQIKHYKKYILNYSGEKS